MYNLRGGFLLRPLIIALSLGCAGALLSWLEETLPGLGRLGPNGAVPVARRSAGGAGHSRGESPHPS